MRWWTRRPPAVPEDQPWQVVIPSVSISPDEVIAWAAKLRGDTEPSRAWSPPSQSGE